MARTRMTWDWAGDWPIFVYMNYVQRGVWDVHVVKGAKGNQNSDKVDTSPKARPWLTYRTELTKDCQLISRYDVCRDAVCRAKALLYPKPKSRIMIDWKPGKLLVANTNRCGLEKGRLYILTEVGIPDTVSEGYIRAGTYNSGVEQWLDPDNFSNAAKGE